MELTKYKNKHFFAGGIDNLFINVKKSFQYL